MLYTINGTTLSAWSKYLYDFLNHICWWQPWEKREPFPTNSRISAGFAGISPSKNQKYILPKQVHGHNLIHASEFNKIDADAIYTKTPDQSVAIQTADCLPILLINTKSNTIMAVHAGWRGQHQRIITKSIEFLCSDSDPENIHVEIGPCISSFAFEVGPEVVESFHQCFPDLTKEQMNTLFQAALDNDRETINSLLRKAFGEQLTQEELHFQF